jgi:hypothetical protein
MLANSGGKEAEEDAAQILFACNVALSADPTMYEKMKISNRVSFADCANALVRATELLDTTIVVPPGYSLLAQAEQNAQAESKQPSQPQAESNLPLLPEKPSILPAPAKPNASTKIENAN